MSRAEKRAVSRETLQQIIEHIVEVAQPEKIIPLVRLFVRRWDRTAMLTFW